MTDASVASSRLSCPTCHVSHCNVWLTQCPSMNPTAAAIRYCGNSRSDRPVHRWNKLA